MPGGKHALVTGSGRRAGSTPEYMPAAAVAVATQTSRSTYLPASLSTQPALLPTILCRSAYRTSHQDAPGEPRLEYCGNFDSALTWASNLHGWA